jgi:hypothetical protein
MGRSGKGVEVAVVFVLTLVLADRAGRVMLAWVGLLWWRQEGGS